MESWVLKMTIVAVVVVLGINAYAIFFNGFIENGWVRELVGYAYLISVVMLTIGGALILWWQL